MTHISLGSRSPRYFTLTLQSGEVVTLAMESSLPGPETPDPSQKLAALLNSKTPSQHDITEFLIDVVPTIFPSADPSAPVSRECRMAGTRIDIAYRVRAGEGEGIIELIQPSREKAELESIIDRVRDCTATHNQEKITELQIIGGRRGVALEVDRHDLQALPFKVYFQTWDDVVDRITLADKIGPDPDKTVNVTVLITASRLLLTAIAKAPSLLMSIDNRKLEELMGTLLFDLGFTDVHVTQLGPDGGIDVHAIYENPVTGNREYFIFQCKHQVTGGKTHLAVITSLESLVKKTNATGGVVVATGGFGRRVMEQRVTLESRHVRLKGPHDISQWIQVWQRLYGSLLFTQADPISLLALRIE